MANNSRKSRLEVCGRSQILILFIDLLIKEFCERLYPKIKALENRIFENSALEIELHFRQKWEPEFPHHSLQW